MDLECEGCEKMNKCEKMKSERKNKNNCVILAQNEWCFRFSCIETVFVKLANSQLKAQYHTLAVPVFHINHIIIESSRQHLLLSIINYQLSVITLFYQIHQIYQTHQHSCHQLQSRSTAKLSIIFFFNQTNTINQIK